jgi:hypothetical protein
MTGYGSEYGFIGYPSRFSNPDKNLGVYFDSHGFGLIEFTKTGPNYKISRLEISSSPDSHSLLKICNSLSPVTRIYLNQIRVIEATLRVNGFYCTCSELILERGDRGGITYRECFDTIAVLLANGEITISEDYSEEFSREFHSYSLGEVNYTVLPVFHGIAIHQLNELANGIASQSYSLNPCNWEY